MTLYEAVKSRFPNALVNFEKACDITGTDKDGFKSAIKAAKKADIVLLALGESWNMSGRSQIAWKSGLARRTGGTGTGNLQSQSATVTLLMAGRPLIFPKIAEKAPAILYCWWLGTEAGTAMADVLWGKYNPSGRLPITFPKNLGQIPVYYNQKNSGRPATDQPENYSGRYIDIDYKPQYPFAYGLSYTVLSYGNIVLAQNNSGVTLT